MTPNAPFIDKNTADFAKFYAEISSNIYAYARALGFKPTFQQMELLDAFQRGDRKITCRSGQGPGKTTCVTCILGFFVISHPFAKAIITAPSMRQCVAVTLTEFTIRHKAAADPRLAALFDYQKTCIGVMGHAADTWGITARTASSPEAAQGAHADYLLIVGEEASGIADNIMEAFYGTVSGPSNRLVLIGNPNRRSGAFFQSFRDPRFTKLHWNAEETPESRWFSRDRNEHIADKFGKDSNVYRVRVRGEFPLVDETSLINPADLEYCMDRAHMAAAMHRPCAVQKKIGIDFARFGSDESVISRVFGLAQVEFETFQQKEPNDVVMRAFNMQRLAGWVDEDTLYQPDANGMGQGIIFRFQEYSKRAAFFYSQNKATKADYANKLTEAWFHFAGLVKRRECYVKKDQRLFDQLTNRRYFLEKKSGRLIIESKDDYVRRGFDSPDRADATVMSFYEPGTGLSRVSTGASRDSVEPARAGIISPALAAIQPSRFAGWNTSPTGSHHQ